MPDGTGAGTLVVIISPDTCLSILTRPSDGSGMIGTNNKSPTETGNALSGTMWDGEDTFQGWLARQFQLAQRVESV